MHLARTLTLLSIATTAALIIVAPTASATDTVQVVSEDTGEPCPDIVIHQWFPPDVEGGCHTHYVGTATLRVDLVFFEVNEATCNLEVESRIDDDDEYWEIEHNTGPDANCATVISECNIPWQGAGEEDGATGVVQSSVNVCLDPSESDVNCEGNLAFNWTEQAGEHYETIFNNATVDVCELDVALEIEHAQGEHEAIHVNHP